MTQAPVGVLEQIVAREPLGRAGASGNALEVVTLADGTTLVRKEVSPEWDWISRATGDDGRALRMWGRGLFDRIPPSIDHATVAVEGDERAWSVLMRDVSPALIRPEQRLGRADVRRVLAAAADLHEEFRGEHHDGLCTLEDRYRLLSPRVAELDPAGRVGRLILRSWELFGELLPAAVADAVLALAHDPGPLAAELARCEQTLIHGDVRLNNLGLAGDRVVLIDWGDRTGIAPAPVELASFMVFDAKRFDVQLDDVVADFRALYGARFDGRAFDLALIGAFVQLGPHFVWPIATGGGDAARAAVVAELEWWTPKVARALEAVGL